MKEKIIIETNPSRESEIYKKFIGKGEMGFKKGKIIMISGDSNSSCDMARLHELTARLHSELENAKIAMINMGEVGAIASKAGANLRSAMIKIADLPDYPMDFMENIDFSKCETIVMDSISPNFRGYYNESGPITKKAWKKLAKKRHVLIMLIFLNPKKKFGVISITPK